MRRLLKFAIAVVVFIIGWEYVNAGYDTVTCGLTVGTILGLLLVSETPR